MGNTDQTKASNAMTLITKMETDAAQPARFNLGIIAPSTFLDYDQPASQFFTVSSAVMALWKEMSNAMMDSSC